MYLAGLLLTTANKRTIENTNITGNNVTEN